MQACMIRKMEVDGGNTLLTLPTDTLGLGAIWLLCSSAGDLASQRSGSRVWSIHFAGVHHSRCSLGLGLVDSGGLLLRAVSGLQEPVASFS